MSAIASDATVAVPHDRRSRPRSDDRGRSRAAAVMLWITALLPVVALSAILVPVMSAQAEGFAHTAKKILGFTLGLM